ncbi:Endonuclease III-like protein [Colletotrichum orbiculare MAFF 240422]|uniref:Endonuclease III homolog n=1 Tax=Colletotrichum orbiculare (strain 104-T / ATCC 96160 / CBS 514.97 / LARS 414 / MAFF 240422) TaxID=1213857 RepID=A0A484F7L6_COLOR|nr:Endonuclease III-like protein [Colletotrichum orbiculare MAFF 240422]
MTSSPSPPRRITRASLARFAYAPSVASETLSLSNIPAAPDIEDVASSSHKRRRVVVTHQTVGAAVKVEEVDETKIETEPAAPRRKARKPARVIKGEDPHVEPPSDWEQMYALVKEMRLTGPAKDAAVDTMGCERLFHPDASERDRRFHVLIALMLSSQTKDTVNAVAMKRLMTELPPHKEGAAGGLNLENILAVDPAKLNELIWAVGFHNNKTKFIKAAAEILREKFDSDVPDTIEGLTSLPGVGPKMAYLCLSAAWDRTEGIGVDVHVHRITNLWGWHKTTQPEATRLALQSWLPRDKWREINWLLVGFGQTAADRKKVIEGRKAKEVKKEMVQSDDGLVIKTEEITREEEVVRDKIVNHQPNGAKSAEQPEFESPAGDAISGVSKSPRRGRAA